jgi:toxin ParE1/3/4
VKLQHSQQFLRDVQHECAFLRERSPAAARQLLDRVHSAGERLKQFPECGRAWRHPGARELVLPGLPYIVIYRIKEGAVVETLKLFHTARDVPHVH